MSCSGTALLIDNSNTRTKFMLAVGDLLLPEVRMLPTAEITPGKVAECLHGWTFDSACICSVVPVALGKLQEALPCPVYILTKASPLSFSLASYEGACTLGADRIANAQGACLYGRFPCVVIDLGTAVTFEVLVENSSSVIFSGGVIAPGRTAMATVLAARTALLPAVSTEVPPSVIGRTTEHSLRSGAGYGFIGMVREILASIRSELDKQPFVIATGGDADFIAKYIQEIDLVDPELTFKGLNAVRPALS